MESPIFTLIFLFGYNIINGLSSSIQRLGKKEVEQLFLDHKSWPSFLLKKIKKNIFYFGLGSSKYMYLIAYTLAGFLFFFHFFSLHLRSFDIALGVVFLLSIFILFDALFRFISSMYPKQFFKGTLLLAILYIFPLYPLWIFLYKYLNFFPKKGQKNSSFRLKDKMLEIFHDSEFSPYLDQSDQRMILSMISFKERIVREIMVPRINMFTLPSNISIEKAVESFLKEEYSRIPIWKDTVDNIVGTLYYKDLLRIYHIHPDELDRGIDTWIKPIVYTPETKKISHLLQEFRNKQIHLAIVVNEYGGTEGIVTIEDILEELVGEIGDETDPREEPLYISLPSGGWIIDSKMTIVDIEKELGIVIPQSPEYDTIGGYIFHKAGAIPSKGWRLYQEDFDLEVLSSSERSIEKIRLIPATKKTYDLLGNSNSDSL